MTVVPDGHEAATTALSASQLRSASALWVVQFPSDVRACVRAFYLRVLQGDSLVLWVCTHTC